MSFDDEERVRRREAAIAKFKATALPLIPSLRLLVSMAVSPNSFLSSLSFSPLSSSSSAARWPENQLYYAIPFCSIQPHKLIDSPDIDTGQMVRDPSNTILYLRNTTGIAALGYGNGHVPGSTDGSELVRIHAAELLDVDP
ncbi:hypothetical protein BS47DRAFT_1344138, partial [Hydnum rufescens UP504]